MLGFVAVVIVLGDEILLGKVYPACCRGRVFCGTLEDPNCLVSTGEREPWAPRIARPMYGNSFKREICGDGSQRESASG